MRKKGKSGIKYDLSSTLKVPFPKELYFIRHEEGGQGSEHLKYIKVAYMNNINFYIKPIIRMHNQSLRSLWSF